MLALKENMTRQDVSQYLMKASFLLSLFFMVEYCLSVHIASHLSLGVVAMILKIVTPIALYKILRRLRDALPNGRMPGLIAWSFGVRVMLFAALPEALFIYVYNQFLFPDTLREMMEQMVLMLEQVQTMTGEEVMGQTLELYRSMPVPTAIQAAVNMLSQDVMVGIFLMLFIAPIVRSKGTPQMPNAAQ